MSWQILSQANFLYDQIYDHNDLENHINEYAALNRNGKESFALTDKAERVRIFNDIAREINTGGEGLATISFVGNGEASRIPFLIAEERDHLQDVANLVTSLKPLGAVIASLLIVFYGFCWYYKVSRYQYFWRPSGLFVSILQIAAVAALCVAITFALGPQQTFYLLHEWAFSDKAQWYFYFEDSLMTTLMPEVVFGNIAALIAVMTVFNWLLINFILRRLLD